MSCDCEQLLEQLELHQPIFPANGWRAIVSNNYKNGRQQVREVPVVGLVWNNNEEYGALDLVVWYYQFCYLSTIKHSKGICKTYTWIVAPNESLEEKLKHVREFLAEQKDEDLKDLKEEAEAVAA